MTFLAERRSWRDVLPWIEQSREEAGCQIITHSILPRELGSAWLLSVDGEEAGFGAVWIEHYPGAVFDFHVAPGLREWSGELMKALVRASGATQVRVQTNRSHPHEAMAQAAEKLEVANRLFGRARDAGLTPPDPRAEWKEGQEASRSLDAEVLVEGRVVAKAGFLGHYNPPYVDIHMEVAEGERGRGWGAWAVQEMIRSAIRRGYVPAARCDVENLGSARTLLAGGFEEVGTVVMGPIKALD